MENKKQKISILILAYKEPLISKAIESALNQTTNLDYDIILSAPDKETLDIAKKYSEKDKRLKIFKDSGKGKYAALNEILPTIKTDVLILTDGDVWMSDNSVDEFYKIFLNQEMGCVTARTMPVEDRSTKYGYWANFLFEAAHKLRKQAVKKNSFVFCSGYLYAIRKEKLNKELPLDVADDAIIPYYIWENGYKISYAENARVYVKNVNNLKDWISQKTRANSSRENLDKYVSTKTSPRVKTFRAEAKGVLDVIKYPKNLKELFWSFQLILLRFLTWTITFKDIHIKRSHHKDNWKRAESSKK